VKHAPTTVFVLRIFENEEDARSDPP